MLIFRRELPRSLAWTAEETVGLLGEFGARSGRQGPADRRARERLSALQELDVGTIFRRGLTNGEGLSAKHASRCHRRPVPVRLMRFRRHVDLSYSPTDARAPMFARRRELRGRTCSTADRRRLRRSAAQAAKAINVTQCSMSKSRLADVGPVNDGIDRGTSRGVQGLPQSAPQVFCLAPLTEPGPATRTRERSTGQDIELGASKTANRALRNTRFDIKRPARPTAEHAAAHGVCRFPIFITPRARSPSRPYVSPSLPRDGDHVQKSRKHGRGWVAIGMGRVDPTNGIARTGLCPSRRGSISRAAPVAAALPVAATRPDGRGRVSETRAGQRSSAKLGNVTYCRHADRRGPDHIDDPAQSGVRISRPQRTASPMARTAASTPLRPATFRSLRP